MPTKRRRHFGLLLTLISVFTILHKCDAQADQDIQRSGRLIAEILEMFAPGQSTDERPTSRSRRLPPYGINRRYTEEERLGVPSSSSTDLRSTDAKPWSSLAQGVMSMFAMSTTTTPAPTTASPMLGGNIFGNLADRFKIPGMFKSLFNSDDEPVTTTTPAPSTLFPTFPTLAPLFPGLFPSSTTQESMLSGLQSMFEKPKAGSQIDTGKMDRFIIREQATNPEDFWSNLVGGNKWNERGIQWEDGSIKLVNKKGSKLLGTEMAVHDRSIDIPVQRWFDIANDVLKTAYQQQQSV